MNISFYIYIYIYIDYMQFITGAGITHVVRATHLQSGHSMHKGVEYLQCDIDDKDEENIVRYFALTTPFISKALGRGGKVLVHCLLGKSRSVSLLAAYLIESRLRAPGAVRPPPAELPALVRSTLDEIAAKRPAAAPTRGFVYQLALWLAMEFTLDGRTSAHRQYR